MGKAEKTWLPVDTTYWNMTYTETEIPENLAKFRSIKATLIVAGTDARSLHRPQVCLVAQGWAIDHKEVVSLETRGGPLKVMDYSLKQFRRSEDGSVLRDDHGEPQVIRAHYVYWWVGPDHTTPSDEERVWRSTLNSIVKGENERWAYPSVMTYVETWKGESGVLDAKARVYEFIQCYAPDFQKSLGAKPGKEGSRKLVTLTQ